ncbi:DedA family protein [Paenibacillus contaminans]|uniref:DedA family protein n=1 Tax=Paenibacillus contaminans TaxID=450362 RepID=A0A329M7A5_9BACL|nr:DedA family protein [Paenibacillus contaminans]RAV15608.1 DedA family protein [Paenibacillus contaminans]
MQKWIADIMNEFGYIGVFLLIALENLFPPIPSEVILTFGGFMTTYSDISVTGVIAASTLGSLAGAIVLYYIGYLIDITRMEAIVNKWGRFLRLTAADVHKTYGWFTKHGVWAVLICRLVPLIRSLISIPAGSTRMNFGVFILLTALGSLVWNTALVCIGSAVGASWETIVAYMEVYSKIVYALIALGVLAVIYLMFRKRKSA